MSNNLPICLCGANDYEGGGGHFGPGGSSEWCTCKSCRRPCIKISNCMTVLALPTSETSEFPKEGLDYINGPLNVTMCAYAKEVEEVRKAIDKAEWNLRCDLLGIPRGSEIKYEVSGRHMQRPNGTIIEDLTVLERFDKMRDSDHVNNLTLLRPPTPPQVPNCLTVYLRTRGGWERVDPAESTKLHVPPDPRRIAHDQYFADIFALLRPWYCIPQPTEIPNRYRDDRLNNEPWYKFGYGSQTYVVDPRKHVISIEIESDLPFSTEKLRALALRDGVTYEADGVWQSKAEAAKKIVIHAHTTDKVIEYLSQALEDETNRT